MPPTKTILVPTDFSPPSEYAFELACSLAKDRGGRLIILHVAVPPVVGYGGPMTAPPEGDWNAMRDEFERIQPPDPKVPAEHRLVVGNPAAEILRVAKDVNCDIIVMGTHGRTGISNLLMGSVAEKIVREAPCPVVTVRTSRQNLRPT